jgi:sulfate permease, SulP family
LLFKHRFTRLTPALSPYNLGDCGKIPEILKLTEADIAVWLITMLLMVLTDLTFAMEVGMILAAFMFIRKISSTTAVAKVTDDYIAGGHVHSPQDKEIPGYVSVFRIHGPFLFGVTDKLTEITDNLSALAPILAIRLRNMTALDATGIAALEELANMIHASGRTVLMRGARPQPAALMHQAGFERHVGRKIFSKTSILR